MKLKIVAVYDSAVGAYMQPMFLQSKGQALRMWLDSSNDTSTQFNKHPKDFTLFEIGEYDDSTGDLVNHQVKVPLGTALEMLSQAKNETKVERIK